MNRNTKRRFQIVRLEERVAPSLTTTLIPSVTQVDANVRGFHGAQNACTGLEHAEGHNPNIEVQEARHGCTCVCEPPPPPAPTSTPSPIPPTPAPV